MAVSQAPPARKVEASLVPNEQIDELDQGVLRSAYARYEQVLGAPPPADTEWIAEQLRALYSTWKGSSMLYEDLVIWGPHW